MGRIKSLMVKKAAKQLAATGNFSEDFDYNKKLLGHQGMPSKPIRNKVVGYIARIVKMKKAEQAALASSKPAAPQQ